MKSKVKYEGFSLVSGGLIYNATTFIRGRADPKKGLMRTAFVLALVTWLPVCIMALISGTLNDDSTTISFFEDFEFHVRFLFVVPFLILIENFVDRAFISYIRNSETLVQSENKEAFIKLAKRLDQLTDSVIPEVIVLVLIYAAMFLNWNDLAFFDTGRNYFSDSTNSELNAAGWYYMIVCTPILQLLVFRWFWRWLVWAYSVFQISRMKLQADPLHADQMVGLEYINLVPLMFSFILIAFSAELAAHIGMEIVFHGASLKEYVYQVAVYIFFLPIVLYLPLVFFIPYMVRAKTYGIEHFGKVIREHNLAYTNTWIENKTPKEEPLLGSVDNSSLADIGGSYAPIQSIKLIPLNFSMITLGFFLNSLPYMPLMFTYYTPAELLKVIVNGVLGF